MPRKIVPLFGRGSAGRVPDLSAQKRTNLYCHLEQEGDKTNMALYPTPGLRQFSYCGPSPSRGAIAIDGNIYTVHSNTVYKINAAAGVTLVGNISTSLGLVTFAYNGTQLMLVDGVNGWIITVATGVLAQIVDAQFPALPLTVCYLAGYFIVNKGGTGEFYWSAILDGTSWDALDFATAESETDNLVAVFAERGTLHLFGELSTEFWAPSGDTNVFTRVGGSGIEWGCVSAETISRYGSGLVFLAKTRLGERRVVALNGYQAQPVDDSNISRQVNAGTGAPTAYSYMIDAHTFYQLNFDTFSLLYDFDSGAWSEVTSDVTGGRHIGNRRVALSDIPYVADYSNGLFYTLDKTVTTDNNYNVPREVITRHMFSDLQRISVWALQLDVATGLRDVAGAYGGYGGESGKIMLQVSYDNGHTWGNELWREVGELGAYGRMILWTRLGRARDMVFKLRVTDGYPIVILNAALQIDGQV